MCQTSRIRYSEPNNSLNTALTFTNIPSRSTIKPTLLQLKGNKVLKYFAYIDPSTGSMFIQAIFGAVLAAGVVFRNAIHTFINKLRLALSRKTTDEET